MSNRFNIYIFRSYKVCETLSDFRNFRLIYSSNPKALENFCQCFSYVLKSEGFLCEMNHVAKLIEVFLKRDPEAMLTSLLQNNILKFLLYYLNFPNVFNLLISLFNVVCPKPLINEIHSLKLMKQLINNEYFIEISNMILNGKWNIKMSATRPLGNESAGNQTDLTQLKNDINIEFYPLFEELSGFISDIDRIKDIALAKKKQNLFKNTSKKIVSVQKMSFFKALSKNDEIQIPLIKKKKSVGMIPTFCFDPRASTKSILSEDIRLRLPNIGEKSNTDQNAEKVELLPAKSYEQFLIRNDKDLKFLEWERFDKIYPSSPRLLRETSLDKISKLPEYSLKELSNKEVDCGLAIEIISSVVRSCLESQNNEKMKDIIGVISRNSDLLFVGLFKQKSDFFNNLFKAFLIKAKVILKEPNTSIIDLGITVNAILRNSQKTWFQGFSSFVSQVSLKHFMFLQKTIMYSYTWALRGQMTIMRILLIEQLYLIIKNEGNVVLDEMLEGLCDTLMKYFLEFK